MLIIAGLAAVPTCFIPILLLAVGESPSGPSDPVTVPYVVRALEGVFRAVRGRGLGTAWLLSFALFAIGLPMGIRLARGRRGLVLFLRRFRYDEAIQVVTSAVRSIGHTWRVVTLDDATIAPVGVAPGLRRSTAAVDWVARTAPEVAPKVQRVAVVVGMPALLVGVVLIAGVLGLVFLPAVHPAVNALADVVVRVLATVLFVAEILLYAFFALVVLLIAMMGIYMLAGAAYSQVVRAEAAKSFSVRNADDIETVTNSVASTGRGVFAPKLAVLTVDTAVWRETVTSLAAVSSVPLVDVSRPTENLLWEIEELGRIFGTRCVFVGHLDRLRRFTGDPRSVDILDVSAGSVVGRLDRLLDGREILAYTTNRRGRIRFTRTVSARLEALAPSNPRSCRGRIATVIQLAAAGTFAMVLAFAVDFIRGLF